MSGFSAGYYTRLKRRLAAKDRAIQRLQNVIAKQQLKLAQKVLEAECDVTWACGALEEDMKKCVKCRELKKLLQASSRLTLLPALNPHNSITQSASPSPNDALVSLNEVPRDNSNQRVVRLNIDPPSNQPSTKRNDLIPSFQGTTEEVNELFSFVVIVATVFLLYWA